MIKIDAMVHEEVLKEANSQIISIDDLMITLFDYIDDFINDAIKNIVTKGGLLDESNHGDIIPSKIEKYIEECDKIFNKIDGFINPPLDQQGQPVRPRKVPNIEQTNEYVILVNDQIPIVLKWMTRVFTKKNNNVFIYDNDDRINMYNACLAYKKSINNLRKIISCIGGSYYLPMDFELPYQI